LHASYAQQYRTLWERHWWWRSRESLVLDRLDALHRRAGRRPWRLLDVGCGDGLFFERLGRFGEVEGLEPDASLVTDPRWRGRIRLGALGPETDLSEARYDVVLMLDVLEHIADDLGALRSVRRALRPGGLLVLTVPSLGWLWSRHDVINEHHRRYEPRGLRRVLEGAGFRVEGVRYFFFWTVAPLLARRWLAPAGGPRVAADAPVKVPPEPVNRLLTLASRAEHAAGRFVRWPVGSSLLAVAGVAPGGSPTAEPPRP
jgi:SAM-dependent methyltransferase